MSLTFTSRESKRGRFPAVAPDDEASTIFDSDGPVTSMPQRPEAVEEQAQAGENDLPVQRKDNKAVFEQLGLVLTIERRGLRGATMFPRDPERDAGGAGEGFGTSVWTGSECAATSYLGSEEIRPVARGLTWDDPVIGRLSQALAAIESTQAQGNAVCIDALRLAVAIRLFTLQSETRSGLGERDEASQYSAKSPVQALQNWRLKRVLEYIESRLSKKLTLPDLAAVAGLSSMYFAAQFRAATGRRPHEYVLRQRIKRAKEHLRGGQLSIVEIALTVGFQNQAHFTTTFRRFAGNTPSQWRKAATSEFEGGVPPSRGNHPRRMSGRP